MRSIPRATVARLARYLQCLEDLDRPTVSSEAIAAAVGVGAPQVRRDLSYLGHHGVRGVGYDTQHLRGAIMRELGLVGTVGVAIIGAGNLGQALAGYGGFPERGFTVAALYDLDPTKVGIVVNGITIRHLDDMETGARNGDFVIAIIATTAEAAPEVLQRLGEAGINSVLNFAPAVLRPPPSVEVRNVDLSTELQILSFYRKRGAEFTPSLPGAPHTA
ncbi:MAG: redox-sensing transcriptional repressor Rex [Acidimicrobiia bacterium]|nr:redox-sensing transcriptional repressor Rex [Acidimicrobiia bacterium]